MNEPQSSPPVSPAFGRHVRLLVEYDGEPYAGWQRQPHMPSVQQTLEETIAFIAGPGVRCSKITGAGRTDSGVHAAGQVASFFTESTLPPERWARALNGKLPAAIRIVESKEAPPTFHPRKDAVRKVYAYHVWTRPTANALDRKTLHLPKPVDWKRIEEAARLFVGRHDFKSFQAARSSAKTSVREIYRFEIRHEPPWRVVFEIEGNGFLKQMVRTIVGTLLDVGAGHMTIADVEACLKSRDRRLAGKTVSAAGLWLREVQYRDA